MTGPKARVCPACKAPAGKPCRVVINGAPMADWDHAARILAPIYLDLLFYPSYPPEHDGGEAA